MYHKSVSPQLINDITKNKALTPFSRISFLASSLVAYKELGRGYYRNIILHNHEFRENEIIPNKALLSSIADEPSLESTLYSLPYGSWMISFQLALIKPYISRDDEPLYIIDNPVRKDKVFKIPMISPSQWKGCLQAVMTRKAAAKIADEVSCDEESFINDRVRLIRLFGKEKENITKYFENIANTNEKINWKSIQSKLKGQLEINDLDTFSNKGRLRFYPSFFNDIGLEIINPHDRVKRVGNKPIYIESVPQGVRLSSICSISHSI